MLVHVSCKPRTKTKTMQALKETRLFSSIYSADRYVIVSRTLKQTQITPSYTNSVKSTLYRIPTIASFTIYLETAHPDKPYDPTSNAATVVRLAHLFFDIDSTLTHPGIKILDRGVRSVFAKFRKQKCSVYFCTGRADHEVRALMKMYKTDDYGIAENGGIIINSTLPACKFGDRAEPDKLITHMNNSQIPFCFDPDQQTRKTEYVIMKDSIKRSRLDKAVKDSGACVSIHESKNTYHVGKAGVDKGTAMVYLTGLDELGLDRETHLVVAVGDSDLDIPMFEHADRSYAVGNADRAVKAKATIRLRENAPKAVAEIYAHLFPAG